MAATVELKVTADTTVAEGKIQNLSDAIEKIAKNPINIKIQVGEIDKATRSVIQYLNAQTRLAKAQADVQKSAAKLATVHAKVQAEQAKATQTANRLATEQVKATTSGDRLAIAEERTAQTANRLAIEQEKTSRATQEYSNKAQTATSKTNLLSSAFRTLAGILISEVRQAFSDTLTEMKAVDTELVTIQKVTGETSAGMKRYADDAYEVATRLGAGASEYLNAVAEFAKAGYGQHAKELGELAITTAKVGDTTQEMANKFLLSVDAAYKYGGSIEKLTAVLDGANEIGNRFPTSVEEIAQGLGKVSPIAAQAHVSIDELTAAIGTITAVTRRSGSEASTALRALFLNIMGDTRTEIEDGAKWTAGEIEGLRDLLKEYAPEVVKAADATKTLINPMEAVAALANAMDKGLLTEQKLMQMVSDIGGKLRSSQLLALIQNFGKYQDMLETYRESAGSAAKEYAIYLESWEAKTKQLSATWTNFVQNQLGTDKIKKLLDTLIDIVENLENWTPLITSIGIAIVGLNLEGLIIKLAKLVPILLSVEGAVGLIVVAIGALLAKRKQYIADLQKEAAESAKTATQARDTAKAMEELLGQYYSSEKGSEAFKTASEKMKAALEEEGIVVKDLAQDYRNLTEAKLKLQAAEGMKALSKADPALVEAYKSSIGLLGAFTQYGRKGDVSDAYWAGHSGDIYAEVGKMFERSNAVKREQVGTAFGITRYSYSSAGNDAASIAAYYDVVTAAMSRMEEEATELYAAGKNAEASALLNSDLYKDLETVAKSIGDAATSYKTAVQTVDDANTSLSGLDKFSEMSTWLKGDKKAEGEVKKFVELIKESTELSATQKDLLLSMTADTYPEYAKSLGLVTSKMKEVEDATTKATSALEKYQQATEKGKEKDEGFKSYKSVYDDVMKAAKRGAYGSNAFQYGIQALLDPAKIEEYKGNWAGLVSYMQKTIGGIYKDSDSMGKGLLDNIVKFGEKAKGSLYEIKEGTELLASYDKKSGEWYISDKPEDIKKLASKLGMSAESLVAAGMALGAMDPDADIEGLSKALESILGTGEEKEDPTITALNASTEAQNNSAEAQNASSEAQTKSAEAEELAAQALLATANAIGKDKHDSATDANGGIPDGRNLNDGPTGYGAERGNDAGEANGRVYPGAVRNPAAMISDPMRAAREGGVNLHPSIPAGALDSANAQIAARMAAEYARIHGTTEEPIPVEVVSESGGASRSRGKTDRQQTWLDNHLPSNAVVNAEESGLVVHPGAGALDRAVAKNNALIALNKGMTPAGMVSDPMRAIREQGTASNPVKVEVVSESPSVANRPSGTPRHKGRSAEDSEAELGLNNDQAVQAAEEATQAAEDFANGEYEAEATLDPSGAIEGAAAATSAIESIPTEVQSSVDVSVNIHYNRGGSGMEIEGDSPVFPGKATGDESFHGGPVLVNDEPGGYNPELIVANGRAFIANGGDPTIISLPRGSVIYNADETRDILNGGDDLFNIPSFARGKASKKYSDKKAISSSSSSGSGGSSSGGSTEFTDEMMKKLEQYMAEILDAAEDALNDQLEAINAQIYALKYQTEAAEKATALEEARLELLEAEKNLLDANTERTVRYYNAATGQWEWMADQREVMRAQEELYDAQKNLLEAEYDALATAWNELKDEISKALENGEEIDINEIIAALGRSAASGSVPALQELIGSIFGYTEDPRAVANFDGGGLASGLGWMPKGTRGTEAVLDSSLTKAILNPQTNAAFTGFTDSLATLFQLAGGSGGLPSSRFMGNVSNLYGGNTYIEGVKIGSDMMNRPLSEVLSTLNLYKNN